MDKTFAAECDLSFLSHAAESPEPIKSNRNRPDSRTVIVYPRDVGSLSLPPGVLMKFRQFPSQSESGLFKPHLCSKPTLKERTLDRSHGDPLFRPKTDKKRIEEEEEGTDVFILSF